jgi:hypothetical protein
MQFGSATQSVCATQSALARNEDSPGAENSSPRSGRVAAPGGHVVVRSVVTLTNATLSGPFKFDAFDPAGNKVQSGSGTATATRFVIAQL